MFIVKKFIAVHMDQQFECLQMKRNSENDIQLKYVYFSDVLFCH